LKRDVTILKMGFLFMKKFGIGGGDSFGSGLIWGMNNLKGLQEAAEFAAAASALKHTIYGDFNRVPLEDVLNLMGGDASGRVQR
jgi:2-dehydro-3-deoxygluconokinase